MALSPQLVATAFLSVWISVQFAGVQTLSESPCARLRAAGKAPAPLKESPSRHAQRRAREDRAEHRVAVLQGRAMPDGERLFREHHERS